MPTAVYVISRFLDEWKVSVTTGVYEPEEDSEETSDDAEDVNSNNNADDRDKKSAKYKVPPRPPTCGLVVVLYGDRGKTSTLPLVSSGSEPGGKSSFQPRMCRRFQGFDVVYFLSFGVFFHFLGAVAVYEIFS